MASRQGRLPLKSNNQSLPEVHDGLAILEPVGKNDGWYRVSSTDPPDDRPHLGQCTVHLGSLFPSTSSHQATTPTVRPTVNNSFSRPHQLPTERDDNTRDYIHTSFARPASRGIASASKTSPTSFSSHPESPSALSSTTQLITPCTQKIK